MLHRLLVAVFAFGVGAAHAATFTVTSTADAGLGTLRDAVDLANAAPGPDTINFAVTGTITLTTGAIRILDALTIQGPGAANLTIDGNQASRIFVTFEASSPPCPATTGPSDFLVTISGLTLRNGWRSLVNGTGGAISSARSLVLDNVIVRDNVAKSGGAIGFWAQFPGQSLTIRDSQFIDNRARELIAGNTGAYQGGALIAGDNCLGVRSPATVTIERSLFTGNRVQPGPLEGRGGAMALYDNITATITDTRIVGNVVEPPNPLGGLSYPGGGINADTTSLTLVRSEVSEIIGGYGGGISVAGTNSALQLPGQAYVFRLINSTVSGNTAGLNTGGVFVYTNVAAQFINSTVTDNVGSGVQLSAITTAGYGTPTLQLSGSILARSRNDALDLTTWTVPVPSLAVSGNNSMVQRTCGTCNITFTGTGNLPNQDPLLAPLAFNGGLTRTHAPAADSPAIDTGDNTLALTTDQRGAGFPRVLGPAPDMGAFESPAYCSGFTDVDPASSFCANVKWLKNRAVTLGCTSTSEYCPTAGVSRLAMAAFMNRLGTALTIVPRVQEQQIGALDPGTSPVVCVTPELVIAGFPRRAYLDGVFRGIAGGDMGVTVDLVRSSNGGGWATVTTNVQAGAVRAGRWANIQTLAHSNISTTYATRFGLRITRGGLPGTATFSDSSCNLRVRFDNRNSTTAPFDEPDQLQD
jgi:hypothetical protein